MNLDQRPELDPHPLSPYVSWAGHRNREPILNVLKQKLPDKNGGHVLELASGSGMHINYFAPNFKKMRFHPSDMNEDALENVQRVTWENDVNNVEKPIKLDLTEPGTWPSPDHQRFDAIFVINIFQVAPITIADSMMKCASSILHDDGFLMIYGPFKDGGEYTTSSNKEFDTMIHSAGVSEWGLKDVVDLRKAAKTHDMYLAEMIDMPANNFSLIFARA